MGKVLEFKPRTNTISSEEENSEDFSARMKRIKDSLDKINNLMADLKRSEKENV